MVLAFIKRRWRETRAYLCSSSNMRIVKVLRSAFAGHTESENSWKKHESGS